MIETPEPIRLCDLKKGIIVPREDFELWLQRHDWTYHQLARSEFPEGFDSIASFQLGCICADPVLWVQCFLREPEDPNHQDPYNLWDYQKESLRYPGHTIHKCGAEVGKTRELVAFGLWKAFTVANGSGLFGAPQQTHLDEIIESMYEQLEFNEDLMPALVKWKKHPHHQFKFSNRFRIDFRPSGHDGEAYRGVHVRTFAIKDEAVKDKNKKQWSEFWRAMKPACVAKIYSVPDGDRSCEFYKLSQRAQKESSSSSNRLNGLNDLNGLNHSNETEAPIDSFHGAAKHIKDIKFRLFQWPKTIMPYPYWSPERKKFYVEQYGGEDSPEYKHNVHGEDGDPEHTVFPWEQLKYCIKDIPEYRCLKILVDSANNEVIVTGYRCEFVLGTNGPQPSRIDLIDTVYNKTEFFSVGAGFKPARTDTEQHESEFRKLIKNFFVSVPGLKRGGADFGYSGDPTEIVVKSIIGKRDRLIARLQLKHVTYDQQCQALDALDDLYGPLESLTWGTDFGNAGSAVAHDLQGLSQYTHKNYEDRLKGFQFESTTANVDKDGEPIIDAKTGEPSKITLKELATDILTKDMQQQDSEYPPDPDIIFYYPNHTCSYTGKHRIYKKQDDHFIDADRETVLAKILIGIYEDLFA